MGVTKGLGNGKTIYSGRNLADRTHVWSPSAHPDFPFKNLGHASPFLPWRSTDLAENHAAAFIDFDERMPVSFFALLNHNLSQKAELAIERFDKNLISDPFFSKDTSWDKSPSTSGVFGKSGFRLDTPESVALQPTGLKIPHGLEFLLVLDVASIESGSLSLSTTDGSLHDLSTGQVNWLLPAAKAGKNVWRLRAETTDTASIKLNFVSFEGVVKSVKILEATQKPTFKPAYPPLHPLGSQPLGTFPPNLELTPSKLARTRRHSLEYDSSYPELWGVGFHIRDPNNSDDFVQAERVFVGQGFQFARSLDHNLRYQPTRSKAAEARKKLSCVQSGLTRAQAFTLLRPFLVHGQDNDIVVIPHAHDFDTAHLGLVHGFVGPNWTLNEDNGSYKVSITLSEERGT